MATLTLTSMLSDLYTMFEIDIVQPGLQIEIVLNRFYCAPCSKKAREGWNVHLKNTY